eukprot:81585-Pyramimonas_sp.AAC.1
MRRMSSSTRGQTRSMEPISRHPPPRPPPSIDVRMCGWGGKRRHEGDQRKDAAEKGAEDKWG